MKRTLGLSLTANLALSLVVLWLAKVFVFQSDFNPGPAGTSAERGTTTSAPVGAMQTSTQVVGTAFRWSELESTNYRTYIGNLRRVGCPEQTIRDMIKADVDTVYAKRRQPLEAQGAGDGSRVASLEALRSEEVSVLEALLGPEPTAPAPAFRGFVREQEPRISMPLALQAVDSSSLNFSAWQVAAVEDVRRRFEQEVTGSGVAPTDPGYGNLWEKAQAESDDLLRAMLGGEDYMSYELAAQRLKP